MSTVRSADGTTIAYTRAGQGPPLILVDGALCSRSFGPMPKLAAQLTPHFTVYTYDRRGRGASGDTPPYAAEREVDDLEALAELACAGETVFVHGTSSGSALALEAAKRIPAIGKLAVYEPPFIVDGTRPPIPDDYLARLDRLVADGRSGDAVKMFMRFVGTPATLTSADWQNSTLISGAGDDVAEQIRELKQRPGRNIGMSGSSTLVGWLLRHDLLDELDLLLFPVVVGSGKRLFSETDGQVPLTLSGSESFSTGVVHLSYQPAA